MCIWSSAWGNVGVGGGQSGVGLDFYGSGLFSEFAAGSWNTYFKMNDGNTYHVPDNTLSPVNDGVVNKPWPGPTSYPDSVGRTWEVRRNGVNIEYKCTAPSAPTADIKANTSDGLISITNNTPATISWTSTNATSCSVTKNGSAFSSDTSNTGVSSGNLTSTTTFTINCTGLGGNSPPDSVEVRILGVSLSASPNSGTAPLNNVSLTATVSGTSSGTYRYFFDCTNDGINELDTSDISSNPYTASNLCNYSSATGSPFTAKVTVWHNYGTAVDTDTVTVGVAPPPPPPTAPLSASCPIPGTTANLSWGASSGATYYALRVDNHTDGWDGTCSSPSGDFCADIASTTHSFSSTPGVTYGWWVHACNANGCSSAASGLDFTCTAPSAPTADIKANTSDGPISITNNTAATISWTSTNATSCSVTKNGSAFSSGTSNTGVSSGNLTSTTTFTINCTGLGGNSPPDSVEVRILGVSLSASPNSGTAPLNNVSLTATVSGTSSGTYRYFFDCDNDGVNERDTSDIASNPYTASNLCNYPSATGSPFTAKVTVWHNYGTAVDTDTVTVGAASQPACTSSAPEAPSTTLTSGSFYVYAYGVTNATAVKFYVWSDVNGQDDLWPGGNGIYAGTNLGGGTWRGAVNMANHRLGNPDYGLFNAHVYMENASYPPLGGGLGQWCGTANFTRNASPTVSTVTVTELDYCTSLGAYVNWTYSDPESDPQSAYQVQIDNQDSFGSPEVDSGKMTDSGTSYFAGSGLAFNTTYKARVRVWDSNDNVSNWTESGSWKTPKHAYPYVDFIYSPSDDIPAKQPVQFTDSTTFYDSGGTGARAWNWLFKAPSSSPSSTLQNPTYTYNDPGVYQVKEIVVDKDGYTCDRTKSITIAQPVPVWKEVSPK